MWTGFSNNNIDKPLLGAATGGGFYGAAWGGYHPHAAIPALEPEDPAEKQYAIFWNEYWPQPKGPSSNKRVFGTLREAKEAVRSYVHLRTVQGWTHEERVIDTLGMGRIQEHLFDKVIDGNDVLLTMFLEVEAKGWK